MEKVLPIIKKIFIFIFTAIGALLAFCAVFISSMIKGSSKNKGGKQNENDKQNKRESRWRWY